MNHIISAISDFIQRILGLGIIGFGILLFAAEVKLAVIKKAPHGSPKLSTFTQRMTKSHLNY